ncbi:GspH/FimT family pseudopilin [Motiliproteus sp. SC1-56]|uniref:GspH/FimT family pseudopilin n=1 Tax=Motiliproteus sp. SC1-56 TaxID=2799565 RepID=UPI001A90641F|nr:GspH/FimT family pseudopilin [Motiliproteus sp. SC1-56]
MARVMPGGGLAAGFTLIELLVVLTIASLLIVLVPMSFSKGMHQLQGQAEVRDLVTTLARARSQAINRQQVAKVAIEPTAYWQVETDKHHLATGWQIETPDRPADPADPTQTRWLRFYPDGTAEGIVLALTDGRKRYPMKVEWLTGRVQVDEPTVVAP